MENHNYRDKNNYSLPLNLTNVAIVTYLGAGIVERIPSLPITLCIAFYAGILESSNSNSMANQDNTDGTFVSRYAAKTNPVQDSAPEHTKIVKGLKQSLTDCVQKIVSDVKQGFNRHLNAIQSEDLRYKSVVNSDGSLANFDQELRLRNFVRQYSRKNITHHKSIELLDFVDKLEAAYCFFAGNVMKGVFELGSEIGKVTPGIFKSVIAYPVSYIQIFEQTVTQCAGVLPTFLLSIFLIIPARLNSYSADPDLSQERALELNTTGTSDILQERALALNPRNILLNKAYIHLPELERHMVLLQTNIQSKLYEIILSSGEYIEKISNNLLQKVEQLSNNKSTDSQNFSR